MRVAIRADAAVQIGTGHVVRCLSLAEELRLRGADVIFITRAHPGHLAEQIRNRGFTAIVLQPGKALDLDSRSWLGVSLDQDVDETMNSVAEYAPLDWMIVDHYGVDAGWHARARRVARHIMIIDDLADRALDADLVVNQNFGTHPRLYGEYVSSSATQLLGPTFALLAAEYRRARRRLERSAGSREGARVLISLGGSDPTDATSAVLRQLDALIERFDKVDVVIGQHSNRIALERLCGRHDHVELHIETKVMAELLLRSDVAIGAGGSSTWERMCLGVPTIMVTLAENQVPTARALDAAGLIVLAPPDWRTHGGVAEGLAALVADDHKRASLKDGGMSLVDGLGVDRVAEAMELRVVPVRPRG